ncbi:hypothetical protein MMAD_31240 [Mycolicibacterium madagascariense]|uniref:Uncharacterized protein n=1 Tax=Mycolicibacterium madagascariense TaxID=212765 RepID=A0A7I7XI05_9MYCO|nr:hypothetical protein [Mycolicibacterium madagascariense]MCV7015805.1 hypothetical protein [Mycolicibacterium madagascariense]BBZ28829.1 hypothetical protein MMAD_31240 [Mycolicibacterium madagascariense]
MQTLERLGNAGSKVVKVQRRLWLIEMLTWPTLILAGVTVTVAAVLWRTRTSGGGRHELPDTPGAHRVDLDEALDTGHVSPS